MLKSETISVQIARPLADVYAFLSNPENLPRWLGLRGREFVQLGNGRWQMMFERGTRVLTFAPPNEFGVLDFTMEDEGRPPRKTAVRVIENDGGTELLYTQLQTAGMSHAAFSSDVEWVRTDLAVLKTYLETAR